MNLCDEGFAACGVRECELFIVTLTDTHNIYGNSHIKTKTSSLYLYMVIGVL